MMRGMFGCWSLWVIIAALVVMLAGWKEGR